jgi:predicted DNA-binding transcriptional regulator YafY
VSKASSMNRVSTIVSRLNEGKRLSVASLALEFETSDRTIRRDISLIKEVFGEFLVSDNGIIYAIKRDILSEVLSPDELSLLKGALGLAERGGLSLTKKMDKKDREKLTGKISDYEKLYMFKTRPFEEFNQHPELFAQLESAVKFHKVIKIDYLRDGEASTFIANPYSIVFLNENFYVASEYLHEGIPSLLLSRVAMIQNIEPTGETFRIDPLFSKFVENFQTAWARYNPKVDGTYNTREIQLQISAEVGRYFKLKKFMPSQNILQTYENGDIRVSFTVTSVWEMVPLCRQWLPHIKVIFPNSLREILLKEAQQAVEHLIEKVKRTSYDRNER